MRMSRGIGESNVESVRMVPLGFVPRKSSDVLELDLGDGAVLYDRDSNLVHHLNPAATIVWHLCDGSADVRQLAAEISEELDVEPRTARMHVVAAVGEFETLGLVEEAQIHAAQGDGERR